jgi:hypothetical protein
VGPVTPHEHFAAPQAKVGTAVPEDAAFDASVEGAAESAAKGVGEGAAGDHVLLGMEAYGLRETAAKIGARTLMDDPQWQASVLGAIEDPNTSISVSLDGAVGGSSFMPKS